MLGAALASLAAPAAALATTAVDPVHAAIEAHEAAVEALIAALTRYHDWRDPAVTAASNARDKAREALESTIPPTTIRGIAALLRYMGSDSFLDDGDGVGADAAEVLDKLADALERMA